MASVKRLDIALIRSVSTGNKQTVDLRAAREIMCADVRSNHRLVAWRIPVQPNGLGLAGGDVR
jgi:hypothetical protein